MLTFPPAYRQNGTPVQSGVPGGFSFWVNSNPAMPVSRSLASSSKLYAGRSVGTHAASLPASALTRSLASEAPATAPPIDTISGGVRSKRIVSWAIVDETTLLTSLKHTKTVQSPALGNISSRRATYGSHCAPGQP